MIAAIQSSIKKNEHRLTLHALERCVERNISPEEIKEAVIKGEMIEYYPEDKYGTSCLIYGKSVQGRILHVLCSLEPVWIITAYDPTLKPKEWDETFKKRRKTT